MFSEAMPTGPDAFLRHRPLIPTGSRGTKAEHEKDSTRMIWSFVRRGIMPGRPQGRNRLAFLRVGWVAALPVAPCAPVTRPSAGRCAKRFAVGWDSISFPQAVRAAPFRSIVLLSARRRLGPACIFYARATRHSVAGADAQMPGPTHVGGWDAAVHMHLDDSVSLFRESRIYRSRCLGALSRPLGRRCP